MAASEQMEANLRGIRTLKLNPGDNARLYFPNDANGELIMYAVPAHRVNLGKVRGNKRCVREYIDKALDPVTGKQKNDGTCPYCELGKLSNRRINLEINKYDEANPNATEKERKEALKKIFQEHQKVQTPTILRGFLTAQITTDVTGAKPTLDDKKVPLYTLKFLPMSSNQYTEKFKTAISQYTDKDPIEIIITNGNKEHSPMDAARALTMNPVVKPCVTKDLSEKIKGDIDKLDLDMIETRVFGFRALSVADITRELAQVQERVFDGLSDEDRKKVESELEEDYVSAKSASEEELRKLFEEEDAQHEETNTGSDFDFNS